MLEEEKNNTPAQETEEPDTESPVDEVLEEPEAPQTEDAAGEVPEKKKRFGQKKDKEAEWKKKLEEEKAAHASELAAEKDKYLRLAAEYDNFRRRSQKEKETVYSDAKADTVLKLLPVYDNLERALKAECTDPAFFKGVEMTMTQLMDIFDKLGVTAIEAEGKPFDPAEHNAVIHIEDESFEENTVVEVFQKGFKLNDKVIRFAMVKVAN